MRALLSTLLVVFCISTTGCNAQFDGFINFKNGSDTTLFDVQLSGLHRNPPVGDLAPQRGASVVMGPQSLPSKVTLSWRFGAPDQKPSQVELEIPAVARDAKDGDLTFSFAQNKSWSVAYSPK